MAMTLVSTVTVGSGGAASIEFTNIPQTGKDLYFTISGRTGYASNWSDDSLSFNNSGQGDNRVLFSSSGTVATIGANNGSVRNNGTSTTASTFSSYSYYVANYAVSGSKTYSFEGVVENNSATAFMIIGTEKTSTTSAITSLKLTKASNDFVQYSTISLYIIS